MGVLIKITGAHFKDPYIIKKVDIPEDDPVIPDVPDEPIIPVTIADYPVYDTTLKGLYDLGGTEEASLVNHADGATATAAVVGTVDFTDGRFAKFSGKANASRIDTKVEVNINSNPIAYVALFSVPERLRTIIGNRRNNSPSAVGLDMQNGIVEYCVDKVAKASGKVANNDAIITDNFIILAMTASTTGYALYRYTNNALNELARDNTVAIDGWPYPFASDGIKIGGCGLSAGYSDAYISLAAIHEGVLTYTQLESICEFVYKYGKNTKGLTIE